MLDDDLGDIIERLNSKTLTDEDIQLLCQLLQQNVNQGVLQSGKFNLAIEEGSDIQVGDRYTGATPEQILAIVRGLVQELQAFQRTPSSPSSTENAEDDVEDLPLRKLVLDSTTVKAINARLEIIQEISESGYLPETFQSELRQLKQRLQNFRTLNEDLQRISEQGDRLIQSAIAEMRLQLNELRLAGRGLAEDTQAQISQITLDCQQAEVQIFQTFTARLENSRLGAEWIEKNMEPLIKYGSRKVFEQFPELDASEQAIDDFKFSLKQFLEQVNFCLYWGTYDILDSREIPLVYGVEQYEVAFQAVKERLSKQLRSETIQEMQACLDYLIECLQLY
ncbi:MULTISPECIES: hypothetical protein [Leptolyngbya]|uniref:hypothetical protein n=1 Tax=Leptolyngbya TaxID=47251 RepID=UPI00168689E7|nr:hypothetical protein [Leptolyngbya sp. FACHB-1624]MBD1854487.1 hypothetical protein [Leptolyngbya sp. FACHB-1624]